MIEKIWRPINNYIGYYEVSNLGNVRSVERDIIGRNQIGEFIIHKTSKLLNPHIGSDKYSRVTLFRDGRRKTILVHRLVAEAFIPNPNKKTEVNHIDRNQNNNVVSNLEWVTKNENMQHALKTGWDPGKSNRGRQFSQIHKQRISKALLGRKFTESWINNLRKGHAHQMHSVRCIEDNINFDSYQSASLYYGISADAVRDSAKLHRTTYIRKTFEHINVLPNSVN